MSEYEWCPEDESDFDDIQAPCGLCERLHEESLGCDCDCHWENEG